MYGDHRNLHVLTHSFPTRRSSALGALRKSFSNPFFRRLVTCGAEEFQNRTGNPPPQAITEPPTSTTKPYGACAAIWKAALRTSRQRCSFHPWKIGRAHV